MNIQPISIYAIQTSKTFPFLCLKTKDYAHQLTQFEVLLEQTKNLIIVKNNLFYPQKIKQTDFELPL